jgi:predicted amidohydrolase
MKQVIAVAQMCSGDDIEANFQIVESLCAHAKVCGAALVCFPENFAFMAKTANDGAKMAESLTGPLFSRYAALAPKYDLEISYGGFQEKAPAGRAYNSHVVVNAIGEIVCVYRKIHLFVVNLSETVFNEAAHVEPGTDVIVAPSTAGQLGLSICYDLRFAELYAALRAKGAEVLLVPAAFTAQTGKAHWEVLLRARAIENQCYVAASAQYGVHNPNRITHGHAMIVDPWGTVVAQCSDHEGIALAEIDLDYMLKIRNSIPIESHRRPELFNE